MADVLPAWIPCELCEDFNCTYHNLHAWECDCPGVEIWLSHNLDPYTDPHPGDDTFKDAKL